MRGYYGLQTVVFSAVLAAMLCMAGLLAQPGTAQAANVMAPTLAPPHVDMAGVGIGFYPQFIGSKEMYFGGAPLVRVHFDGDRYIQILINELRVDLLDDPNWSFGPLGLLRFGRYDVDNTVVDRMRDIPNTVELGGFLGYTFLYGDNPLEQINVNIAAQADIGNVHNGWVVEASLNGLLPVVEFLTLTGGAASTWGSEDYTETYFGVDNSNAVRSGLELYSPGSGVRDVRGYTGLIFHASMNWHFGAGVMYSNVIGPAADSPIVQDEGTPSQWVFGTGVIYSW